MPRGLIQPFQRDLDDFANADGSQELDSRVEQVLGTRATSPNQIGELPWRPEFGSTLEQLRHLAMTEATDSQARDKVGEALRRWLPELTSTTTEILRDQKKNQMQIRVKARRRRAQDISTDTTVVVVDGTS